MIHDNVQRLSNSIRETTIL